MAAVSEEMNDRRQRVLRAVVQSYIQNPSPVGSRLVTRRYKFNLSSATIRNIMADLEEMGYLVQPHTSAGRVPTDKGFRFYVDQLDPSMKRAESEAVMSSLERKFKLMRDDINHLLGEVAHEFSFLTNHLVFAMPLRPTNTTLNRVQLYRYRGGRTVAVLMTNEGLVTSRVIDRDFGISQRDLDRISDFLNSEFSGYTIDEIRLRVVEQMSREKALADMMITQAINICREALAMPGAEIILSGLPELIGLPEFSDRIERIAKAIEDKSAIVSILDSLGAVGGLAHGPGVHVAIGREIPNVNLQDLSIVTAEYCQGTRALGSVGLIGPMRMDYARTIPLVSLMARFVSESLNS